jgi:hypothetical protein
MINMESKRALRRHHAIRIKRKVYRQLKFTRWIKDATEAELFVMVCRRWQNRKPCSCVMCCNPRRRTTRVNERLPIQERRFLGDPDRQIGANFRLSNSDADQS